MTTSEKLQAPELKHEHEEPISEIENVLASAPIASEQQFEVGATEAVAKLDTSKKSWGAKLKNMVSKGLDTVVSGSYKFATEGYGTDDVKGAWNKGKEIANKGLDTIVNASSKFSQGYEVNTSAKMDRFIEGSAKFVTEGFEINPNKQEKMEQKNTITAQTAELQEMSKGLAASPTKEGLESAKQGILTQAENIIAWGENANSVSIRTGETKRNHHRESTKKYQQRGLENRIKKVGEQYKSKKMNAGEYNTRMSTLQKKNAKFKAADIFTQATEEVMGQPVKVAA